MTIAEQNTSTVAGATDEGGFVDFYELLQTPDDTPTEQLQARMAALNSEALANSDHRNLNKRRDYQTLREYIPQARAALLDPAKRALYDDYAAQARGGNAPTSFTNFMGQLSGQVSDDERTDILGVQDGRGASKNTGGSKGTSIRSTGTTTRPTPINSGDAGGVTRRQPQVSGAKSGPPVAVIAVVVVLILLVLFFALKR